VKALELAFVLILAGMFCSPDPAEEAAVAPARPTGSLRAVGAHPGFPRSCSLPSPRVEGALA